MSQIDEKHMDVELDFLLQNPNISKIEIQNKSIKQIQYNLLFYKYILLLKEESKNQENKEKELLYILSFIENKNNEKIMNKILTRRDIEYIFKNINEGEIINNNEYIKELKNKSIEDSLKEIYTNNLIDIKNILNIFEVNNYNKIFKNIYYL